MHTQERKRDKLLWLLDTAIPAVILAFLLAVILAGVANRFLNLGLRLHWIMELSNIAFTWIVFLGGAACFRLGVAISVESFYAMMPPRMRRFVYGAGHVLIVVVCVIVAYYGYFFMQRMWPQTTSMMGISQGWRAMALPVGMMLIALSSLLEIIRVLSSGYEEVDRHGH